MHTRQTPTYQRARFAAIEQERSRLRQLLKDDSELSKKRKQRYNQELACLAWGFFPPENQDSELVHSELSKGEGIDSEPLTTAELLRYGCWFSLHPDKVVGKEVQTTSREFPVQVRGSKVQTIKYFNNRKERNMSMKAKALKLRMQMQRNRRRRGSRPMNGLGELNKGAAEQASQNPDAIARVLEKSEAEKIYKQGDTLSFEEVAREYNRGISKAEIKAWVWYKRSLGVPMTGWEDYFLSSRGKKEKMLRTRTETTLYSEHWKPLRTLPGGKVVGKWLNARLELEGYGYNMFRNAEGIFLVRENDVNVVDSLGNGTDGELSALVKEAALFYLNGELLPYPVYAYGNMYDRIQQLQKDASYILKAYGPEILEKHWQVIKEAKPKPLSVTNPNPNERPRISLLASICQTFNISELQDQFGQVFEKPISLWNAFIKYLGLLDGSEIKDSSAHEIVRYYMYGKRITGRYTKEESKTIKANASNQGEAMFQKFLHEALTIEDQKKLDLLWNRLYNGQSHLPYHRIPIGFEASAKFKQFNFRLRPAQREGIAFIGAVGSGIIAYDVGVGKTMTAIATLADAIHSGKAKRPLVVVPNATYDKWMGEIMGFSDRNKQFVPGVLSYTGIEVNDWYNLGKKYQVNIDFEKAVPEKSITLVSYEGFKKVGFSEQVMDEMLVELANIHAQSKTDLNHRDKEIEYQKYSSILGLGIQNTIADIDTLGFDMLVIDEAHRCKNIFSQVKKDHKGVKRYQLSSAVSETGIKAFFLCNFVQRRFNGNVILLTATPFTNSPLEIYSMLSLVALSSLKQMNIQNIQEFFQLFVQEEMDWVVDAKGQLSAKSVVKRFTNRLLLQKLIYNHINYKTGEEAGIPRPCKINLPRIKEVREGKVIQLPAREQVATFLGMTPEQLHNQRLIQHRIKEALSYKRAAKLMVFQAMSWSLDNALSPFLFPHAEPPEDHIDFVENSPKIHYALKCIQSVRNYHSQRNEPVSGQVIYLNRGKVFFPLIKQYLEDEIGYQAGLKWGKVKVDQVEIITSGMSNTRKENVKNAFLDGVVKVIIGTSTIREGIDLQTNSTVLYNLYPDWNPTDIRQLEGRIWRQGNRFGYVRVVMPLVQDSMDVFVFQKLEEKTSRINDIWYRADRGNVLDVESLDPEEVKYALITDVQQLSLMKLNQEKARLEQKKSLLSKELETLKDLNQTITGYQRLRDWLRSDLQTILRKLETDNVIANRPDDSQIKKLNRAERQWVERKLKFFDRLQAFMQASPQTDKQIIQLYGISTESSHHEREWKLKEFMERSTKVKKAERTILHKRGLYLGSDLSSLAGKIEDEERELQDQWEKINSPDYLQGLMSEAAHKKSTLAIEGESVDDRVEDFTRLNYLLDYRSSEVDSQDCVLPEPGSRKAPNFDLMKARAKALSLKLKMHRRRRERLRQTA